MNKIILITGCSSGFGMLTAARLAAGGHTIYATMRNLHKQDTLKQELAKRETECQILHLDVTDDISINKVIKTIEKQAGRLDVLINNATNNPKVESRDEKTNVFTRLENFDLEE